MSDSHLRKLAQISQLRMVRKGPWGLPAVAGSLQGFPVAAGWIRTENKAATAVLVRFKPGTWTGGPEGLRPLAESSGDLQAAFGKSKLPSGFLKGLQVTGDAILATWNYSFFKPKPETVLAVLRALVSIAAKISQPIGATCEKCGREAPSALCLAEGIPSMVCEPCRLGQDEEARRLQEAYDRIVPNPLLGILLGFGSALLLALLWGGVAYAINRIFVMAAIGIGLAIAWAVNWGMGKVNLMGRILTVLLTVATVLVGDFIFMLLTNAKAKDLPIDLSLITSLAGQFWNLEFSESSGFISVLFALIGAGYILFHNRPPQFQVRFEPLN